MEKSGMNTIKTLFNRQWVNGDLEKFMESVRSRTKEMHGIDLEFEKGNTDQFLNALIKNNLLDAVRKP